MSLKRFAQRQLDELFKPKASEFVSPLSPAVKIVCANGDTKISVPKMNGQIHMSTTTDKLDRLLDAENRKKELDAKAEERAEKEKIKKEKRAKAARIRRKLQADQIKRIKDTLSIPLAERLEAARLKRENQRIPSMHDGKYMTDNGRRGPRISTGGFGSVELDLMDSAGPIGLMTDSDSEAVYGQAAHCEGSGDNDEGGKFHAQLDVDASFRQRVMHHVRQEYFQDIGEQDFPDSLFYSPEDATGEPIKLPAMLCKLCNEILPVEDGETDYIDSHAVYTHGHESEPDHESRFGDVIERMAKELISEDRKRAKKLKKPRVPLEQFLNEKEVKTVSKEDEAKALGLVKGKYIYDSRSRKFVQSWIRTKK